MSLQLSLAALAVAATATRAEVPGALSTTYHVAFTLDFGWKFNYGDIGVNRTGMCEFDDGFNVGTGSIAEVMTTSFADCCAACAGLDACIAWDWDSSGSGRCFLKNNTIGNSSNPARVTGTLPASAPSNATLPGYNDSSWPIVNVPHDYSINQSFAATNDANHAYLPKPASWYRKNFKLDAALSNGAVTLLFDGSIRNTQVWLNGVYLGSWESGYTSFAYPLNGVPGVVWGGVNTLAIRVDPSTDTEGTWWYEGSGLVRHVWLHAAPGLLNIPLLGGVFVAAEVVGEINAQGTLAAGANVTARTQVANNGSVETEATVTSVVLDAAGTVVGQASVSVSVAANAVADAQVSIALTSPSLWAPDHAYLYTLLTTIEVGSVLSDNATTRFGVRQVNFDPNAGLILNGVHTKIKGFCQHADVAGMGAALTQSVQHMRVKMIKSVGANAWRMSHNPPAPGLLDLLDEEGILVMEENRDPLDESQLTAMIRRDRNHASVIMWSLCNEVACPDAETAAPLVALSHALDPTRPTTAALLPPNYINASAMANVVDVIGMNYNDNLYDAVHAAHPTKGIFASETSRCMIVRGVYEPMTNYSTIESGDACMREWWTAVSSREFMAGIFVWVSHDFMGEPKPVYWPQVSAIKGIFDAILLPKDPVVQYTAWWVPNATVLHVFPHWSWAPGDMVSLWAYTTAAFVELWLNGASLGRQAVPPGSRPEGWNVSWVPGNVTAIGYASDNETVLATAWVATTGDPAALRLTLDAPAPPAAASLTADGWDTALVTVAVVDSAGAVIPTAMTQVDFSIDGGAAGILGGVHNGDPLSHEPHQGSSHALWMGLARVWLRAGLEPGEITLRASAPGLRPASITIPVVAQAHGAFHRL